MHPSDRPGRTWALAVALALTAPALFLAPAATTRAAPTVTGAFLDGEPTEWVSAGDQWIFAPPEQELTTVNESPNHDYAGFLIDPAGWRLDFTAPAGQSLTAGVTYQASYGSPPPGVGSMWVGGDGRGCSRVDGEFTVLEVAYNGADLVTAFAADFRQRCDDGRNADLYGSIRFNSSFGLRALAVDPDSITFGDVTVDTPSAPRTITIENGGSSAVQFSVPEFIGPGAAAFEIVGTPCAVVLPGASCTVVVRVNTATRGPKVADLVIDDSTHRGQRRIPLTAAAWIATTTSMVVTDVNPPGGNGPAVTVTVSPNPGPGLAKINWTGGGGEGDPGHTAGLLDPETGSYAEVPLGIAPGTWTITATFLRYDYYETSSTVLTDQFVPVGTRTMIQSDNSNTPPGSSTHITAEIRTSWNAALPPGTLTIRNPADEVLATAAVGGATRTLESTVCCLPIGEHVFTAAYVPDTSAAFGSTGSFIQAIAVPPVPSGTVQINGGAATTTSALVNLTLPASVLEGTVTQMRLSNNGINWHVNTYASSTGWDLTYAAAGGTPGDGVRTVYAQFATNNSAWSAAATDTIRLDRTAPNGSIAVAGGAATTGLTSIFLSVPASDSMSAVSEVALSNTGLAGSWTTRPYAATQSWTLPATNGTRTVFAKWKDEVGNWSAAKGDTIVLDTMAPTGTISIAGGAAGTRLTVVSLAVPATDAVTGLSQVALSNDGTTWTTRSYAATQSWTLPATNGTRTVYAKWKDAAGNWSAVKSDTIVLDTVAPVLTAPTWRLGAAGTALVGGAMPVRIAWTGSDATSGIARHSLSIQVDGGAWTAISTSPTTPALTRNLAPGHTYRFAVRATDVAGNTSPFLYGPTFRLTGLQQSASGVTYARTWATSTSTTWWGGTARSSSTAGATAKVTFTGRQFTWIGLKAANRGKAQVFVNGVLTATVDLYNATQQGQRVVWSGAWSTSATRTITIKVLATAGRPRVDVDGFFVGN